MSALIIVFGAIFAISGCIYMYFLFKNTSKSTQSKHVKKETINYYNNSIVNIQNSFNDFSESEYGEKITLIKKITGIVSLISLIITTLLGVYELYTGMQPIEGAPVPVSSMVVSSVPPVSENSSIAESSAVQPMSSSAPPVAPTVTSSNPPVVETPVSSAPPPVPSKPPTPSQPPASSQPPVPSQPPVSSQPRRYLVPNVQGLPETTAISAFTDGGFTGFSIARQFNDSVDMSCVYSQSVAGGTYVDDANSNIIISVSKGKHAPTDWTTDNSFLNNPYYTHATKKQYQVQTRSKSEETTTNKNPTLDGWSCTGSKDQYSDYGTWSNWQDAYVAGNDLREVATQAVSLGEKTQIYLGRYYSASKDNFFPRPLDSSYSFDGGWFDQSDVQYKGQVYAGGEPNCYTVTGCVYYFFPIGEYGGQTKTVSLGEKPQYRFRDRTKSTIYSFKRTVYSNWSSPSGWQDSSVSENDCNKTSSTREVYKYTPQ